jgi:hypothetical protein
VVCARTRLATLDNKNRCGTEKATNGNTNEPKINCMFTSMGAWLTNELRTTVCAQSTAGWRRTLFALTLLAIVMQAARADEELRPENYKPQWKVGQQWVVASVSLQSQARRDPKAAGPAEVVRWQFDVWSVEKIDERNCFKVDVKCLLDEGQAVITLWVDQQSMTLRRVQTRVPVAGGFRTVTEDYRSASGQPFPAFAPLTVPPLELPLFLAGTKGAQTFAYQASSTPAGEKGVGDIDFSFSVDQQITRPLADNIKGLLPEEYSKDLSQKAVVEVQLKTASFQTRQLWQPGLPWPVYSNNGVAESRLIEVIEPAHRSNETGARSQP